ncbi:MAG: DNA methyltransferase [Nanoarchaeota archaeon]|nr:site-specific DNA-methyltransferase [Nanoarchaeota archaeon]MBU4300064.1 site-specific DNA-methyltransferase [Nanoarchaeota archaeon]MBU4451865.1 site-specific DNA-methyltransferase [Nanoarchaeota archaeon]MCG2724399.1 site-specific DNA-methyltransferase [archaeon]
MPDYKLTYRLDLGTLATFLPNKRVPIYNWYYYKESFSRDLVFYIIDSFGIKAGDKVLDPFCGIGTTLLACREKCIDSIGSDVSEIAVFASRAKTRIYGIENLREEARNLFKDKFVSPCVKIDSGVVNRCFSKFSLERVISFRDKIAKIEDETVRDFMMLALMVSAMETSSAKKTGRSIRSQKNQSAPPLKFLLKRRIKNMLRDLKKTGSFNARAEVMQTSATVLNVDSNSVDAIITSPPYLGKTEYAQIYSIEQVLFFGGCGRPHVKSFIGEQEEVSDIFCGKHDLPKKSFGYFHDMNLAILEMHRVLKSGGKAAIIVGEGCFPDKVVASDILLAELAENAGFIVREILVLNERWCMRERTEKVGKLRESLIVLEKQ